MMAALRILLILLGGFLAFAGTFFALQGAGVIMWPAESFMLADRQWVINGCVIAAAGVAVLFLGFALGRRSR